MTRVTSTTISVRAPGCSGKRGRSAVHGVFAYHDNAMFTMTQGWDPEPARAESNKGGTAWLKLTLEFTSSEQVVRVLQRLDQVPYVDRVRRVAK